MNKALRILGSYGKTVSLSFVATSQQRKTDITDTSSVQSDDKGGSANNHESGLPQFRVIKGNSKAYNKYTKEVQE
jgi:hypothetical protein